MADERGATKAEAWDAARATPMTTAENFILYVFVFMKRKDSNRYPTVFFRGLVAVVSCGTKNPHSPMDAWPLSLRCLDLRVQ